MKKRSVKQKRKSKLDILKVLKLLLLLFLFALMLAFLYVIFNQKDFVNIAENKNLYSLYSINPINETIDKPGYKVDYSLLSPSNYTLQQNKTVVVNFFVQNQNVIKNISDFITLLSLDNETALIKIHRYNREITIDLSQTKNIDWDFNGDYDFYIKFSKINNQNSITIQLNSIHQSYADSPRDYLDYSLFILIVILIILITILIIAIIIISSSRKIKKDKRKQILASFDRVKSKRE